MTENLSAPQAVRHPEPQTLPAEAVSLKQKVLNWLQTMGDPNGPIWEYQMNQSASATIFTSCFALFVKHLFNDLETLSEENRQAWLQYIQEFQDPATGLFRDPQAQERVTDANHDTDHLDKQLTTFCLSAIDAMGGKPNYPIHFLEEWTPEYLIHWMEQLNWGHPWNSGNRVMFLAICLIYNFEHFGNAKSKETLDTWFDWLDKHQNPQTGFWGTSRTADYFDGMGGFYHEFLIYQYCKRDLHYVEQIVDRILFLQQADGLFFPGQGGGACDDIDGISPLVHFYHKYDYRREDIKRALQQALQGLLDNQQPDGGFCWANRRQMTTREYWLLMTGIVRDHDLYYWYLSNRRGIRSRSKKAFQWKTKTGWNQGPRSWWDSSLFDTWLRCQAIAEISSVLTGEPYHELDWQFLPTPGLGWFGI